MIAYVCGKIEEVGESKVVVDVHDMGFQVFATSRDVQAMPSVGSMVKLHTFFSVKEDSMQLFWFSVKG